MKTLVWMAPLGLLFLYLPSCSHPSADPKPASDPYAAGKAPPVRFAWPDGKRAAVCLTFDDARPSQVDVGVPILNQHGVRATFYVSPSRVPERLDRWKQAIASGHEIGTEGRQTTRVDTLRAFCEYARDPQNGLWVDTVATVTRHVLEQRAAVRATD